MTVLLDSALAYAAADMFVFPCLPRGKAPDGALVPHGVKEATNEAARIRRWWSRSPAANIGIAIGVGALFGVRVLDVDPKNGGDAELRRLVACYGSLPTTAMQRSGSGGMHALFRWPSGDYKTKAAAGVEILGVGRYFVSAPSVHPISGARYAWTSPPTSPLAPAPAWLLALARRPESPAPLGSERPPIVGARYARGALISAAQRVERAVDGDRNNALNREAFALSRFVRSGDLDENLVRRVLVDAARAAGLAAFEIDRTISSALRSRKAHA